MSKYDKGSIGWLKEKAKEHGFENIKDYIVWAKENGELPNDADVSRKAREKIIKSMGLNSLKEYKDYHAQKRRYKDSADVLREWRHDTGRQSSMSENKDCSSYLGVEIAEKKIARIILPRILGEIKKEMPYKGCRFDYLIEGDIKVDSKAGCLIDGNRRWSFFINHNDVAGFFLIIAFDSRDNLYCEHIWLFERNEMINGAKFYMRGQFKITNDREYLSEYKKFEVTDKLSEKERHCKEE